MTIYDPNDLKSTLAYIKDTFGLSIFANPGRVPAVFSDLAPGLKSELNMLKKLSRLGIFEEFVENSCESESAQKRVISRSLIKLIQDEYIRPEIALSYIRIMIGVFGWGTEVEIPKVSDTEKEILNSDKATKQNVFDHFCREFMSGQMNVLYDLGRMYFIEGFKNDFFVLSPSELIRELVTAEKSSESSDLAYLLGEIYFNGYRVHENKAVAERWYLKACDKGSISAALRLFLYYFTELKLYDKGFFFLEKAHEGGSIEAALLLGLCYKRGIGVEENYSIAETFLREAAEKFGVGQEHNAR